MLTPNMAAIKPIEILIFLFLTKNPITIPVKPIVLKNKSKGDLENQKLTKNITNIPIPTNNVAVLF